MRHLQVNVQHRLQKIEEAATQSALSHLLTHLCQGNEEGKKREEEEVLSFGREAATGGWSARGSWHRELRAGGVHGAAGTENSVVQYRPE